MKLYPEFQARPHDHLEQRGLTFQGNNKVSRIKYFYSCVNFYTRDISINVFLNPD